MQTINHFNAIMTFGRDTFDSKCSYFCFLLSWFSATMQAIAESVSWLIVLILHAHAFTKLDQRVIRVRISNNLLVGLGFYKAHDNFFK